jgi:hypothetical protein
MIERQHAKKRIGRGKRQQRAAVVGACRKRRVGQHDRLCAACRAGGKEQKLSFAALGDWDQHRRKQRLKLTIAPQRVKFRLLRLLKEHLVGAVFREQHGAPTGKHGRKDLDDAVERAVGKDAVRVQSFGLQRVCARGHLFEERGIGAAMHRVAAFIFQRGRVRRMLRPMGQ